tara:strand:- start:937 stop:1992 length:1056 start_codon:yes stop_codon:yes gene_type:complete
MALSLIKEGYNISIIHTGHADGVIPTIFKKIIFIQLKVSNKRFIKYISFYHQVKKTLKKNRYSTLIAGDLYSLANICRYKHNTHLIYDCREIYFHLSAHSSNSIKRYLSYQYEKKLLQHINTIFVTAQTDLEFLKNIYQHYKHLNWYLIYNFPSGKIKGKKNNLKLKYNIPSHHQLIIYQGVIQKHRGILKLIKVVQATEHYTAFVIGDGPILPYLKKYVKKNKLHKKIHFIGKLPYFSMFKYTANCDIGWVMIRGRGISNQFALPNKLFEYTLMGLKIIASSLSNIKPIVKNNNFGICIDSFNTTNIIQALKKLDKTTTTKSQIIKQSKSKFIWDIQHHKFIKAVQHYDF